MAPYDARLCDKCLATAKDHKDVVVSMSVYRREVRDFLRERLTAGVVILKLECDVDIVVKSANQDKS